MDLLNSLKKRPFLLAPMAGVTDCAFRSYMKSLGAEILITELVSAQGIRHESEQTLRLMKFTNEQHPVGVQLFGETPEAVADAAKFCQERGADFVDLNFGCPVKKVVKKGAGSAILKDLKKVTEMFRTVKSAIEIPLTVKIRTGWDHDQLNADQVAEIAYDEGLTWVAIHGRTRSQGYSGESDWDYIARVKATAKIPIIGNGDVVTPELAVKRKKESRCDGVMIGRGCLKNPFIFEQAQKLYFNDELSRVVIDPYKMLDRLREHLEKENDERLVGIQLKKFSSWYSAGYPGSANFRKNIFQHHKPDEIMSVAQDYFGGITVNNRKDTSKDKFLMGGHG